MRMSGKAGIVTAAASGAGRAGALVLAREGAAVCIVDQNGAGSFSGKPASSAIPDPLQTAFRRIASVMRSTDGSAAWIAQM